MVSLSSALPVFSFLLLNTHASKSKLLLFFHRVEEVPVRHLLTVWTDFGHFGRTKPEDEGSGLCYL